MTVGPLDPTLQEIEDERNKAKAKADADAKAKADKDAKKKASYDARVKATKWAQDWYLKLNQSSVNVPGSNTPVTLAVAISNMSWAYKNLSNKSITDPGQIKQLEETFSANKKAFQTLSKQFEKKYNKSIFDVINNYNKYQKDGAVNPLNPTFIPTNQIITPEDLNILNVVLKKDTGVKLLPPKTTDQTPSGPGGEGASNPVLGPGKIEQTVDSNGNPVYRWSNNNKGAVDVAFVGDKNGAYITTMAAPDYDNAFAGAELDPKSPMSLEGYYSKFAHDLMSTPGAVDKLKNLLIVKHIIPPHSVNSVIGRPGEIDGTTSNAIRWAIGAVTAHNVALFNLGKPNQKFMTLEDYVNNMSPIDISSTSTSNTYQKIQPKDYELSIDDMFQRTIGRGATKEELAHFTKQLQSYANANPEVTTTTKTDTVTGDSSSSTVSGGVTDAAARAMMRDEGLKNPEAEGFTKGAKFFSWFQQAIDAPVQLGG